MADVSPRASSADGEGGDGAGGWAAARYLGEVRAWATRIAGRYLGVMRAKAFGERNGVPGELLVRVTPTRVIARSGISD